MKIIRGSFGHSSLNKNELDCLEEKEVKQLAEAFKREKPERFFNIKKTEICFYIATGVIAIIAASSFVGFKYGEADSYKSGRRDWAYPDWVSRCIKTHGDNSSAVELCFKLADKRGSE